MWELGLHGCLPLPFPIRHRAVVYGPGDAPSRHPAGESTGSQIHRHREPISEKAGKGEPESAWHGREDGGHSRSDGMREFYRTGPDRKPGRDYAAALAAWMIQRRTPLV